MSRRNFRAKYDKINETVSKPDLKSTVASSEILCMHVCEHNFGYALCKHISLQMVSTELKNFPYAEKMLVCQECFIFRKPIYRVDIYIYILKWKGNTTLSSHLNLEDPFYLNICLFFY